MDPSPTIWNDNAIIIIDDAEELWKSKLWSDIAQLDQGAMKPIYGADMEDLIGFKKDYESKEGPKGIKPLHGVRFVFFVGFGSPLEFPVKIADNAASWGLRPPRLSGEQRIGVRPQPTYLDANIGTFMSRDEVDSLIDKYCERFIEHTELALPINETVKAAMFCLTSGHAGCVVACCMYLAECYDGSEASLVERLEDDKFLTRLGEDNDTMAVFPTLPELQKWYRSRYTSRLSLVDENMFGGNNFVRKLIEDLVANGTSRQSF